ncbi:MAG: hypothetical protein ABI601_18425 [bacterium]
MSWPASIFVALLTAVVACVFAGVVALLCVDWYRISSFEGKSGYYVVGIALVGLVAGFVIGLAASRIVAGTLQPSFLKSLGASLLVVLVVAGVIGGTARLMADVPPKIAGEELLLAVEIRWPASQTKSPATDTVAPRLRLRALAGNVARIDKEGPLWMEDAHLVDGRWVVPGAVEVFTSRGGRMLEIDPAPGKPNAFLLPLPAYPGKRQLEWSEWMPRARPGAPPLPDGMTLRFKVLPRSQPVRTQTFGPFEIATVAESFYPDALMGVHGLATSATFRVTYRGAPVVIEGRSAADSTTRVKYDRADAVALLPGAPDALLVRATSSEEAGPFYLIVAEGDHVRSEYVAPGALRLEAPLVTNDVAKFRQARDHSPPTGTVDAMTYAQPGDFLFEGALLSTQPPAVLHFGVTTDQRLNPNVRPLGISPDRHHVVRVGYDEDHRTDALVVTDPRSGESTYLPIDAVHTRVSQVSALDPEWLQHYYAWTPSASGGLRLEPRASVTPLPWRGALNATSRDGYREYEVGPAGKAMFDAMAAFLTTEMGATRTAEDLTASGFQMHVNGQVVHLFDNDSEHHVSIYMDFDTDTRLVATIAERFDAALATGKYDALFTTDSTATR